MKRIRKRCIVWLLTLSLWITGGIYPGSITKQVKAADTQGETEHEPEIASDAVWLSKEETGSLPLTMEMPDLYYTAGQDEADAHGSGPCGSNTLWVRLPSSASVKAENEGSSFFLFHRKLRRGSF